MNVKIAQRLEDIDITLHNNALTESNYADYYVVTNEGRGEDPISEMSRKLRNQKDENLKILFSGFKGCGKSTELLRLKRELENDFLIKIFSVRERLDYNKLTVSEILITVMKDLFDFVNENYKKIKLSKKLIQNLENWTKSIYAEEITYNYYKGELAAGANIGAGFGKILNVFARLGLDFNAGRKFQEITRKDVNQTLTELILNCNLLIMEVRNQLHKIGKHNILFIIEDLEKVTLEIAEEIFYKYAKQLTAISCCIIYTFPISLVFNPTYNIILGEFDETLILPMIKVHDKKGKDYKTGIDSIVEIIHRRIDAEQKLVSRKLLKEFILMSGGCLRDLFRMLKLAAGSAIARGKSKIEKLDFTYSLNKLKNDYYNTVSYNERNGITAAEYYKILVDCCNSPDKKPMDERGMMDLKHNMCVLGYNGDSWYDVHPVVKEILKDKKMIENDVSS